MEKPKLLHAIIFYYFIVCQCNIRCALTCQTSKKWQIKGACLAGASVTLTQLTQLFGVLRTKVFTIMTAYKKNDITSPVKKKSGRKPNMNNREGCVEGLWETAKDCVETTQNC